MDDLGGVSQLHAGKKNIVASRTCQPKIMVPEEKTSPKVIWQFGVCPRSGFRQNLGMLFIPMNLRTFIFQLVWLFSNGFKPLTLSPNRSPTGGGQPRDGPTWPESWSSCGFGAESWRYRGADAQSGESSLGRSGFGTWSATLGDVADFPLVLFFLLGAWVWIYCYINYTFSERTAGEHVYNMTYIYTFIFQQIHILIM